VETNKNTILSCSGASNTGKYTDAFGNKLSKIRGLGGTFCWVASGNAKLHKEILRLIEMG
jgi:uncharacterized metal-binding protein